MTSEYKLTLSPKTAEDADPKARAALEDARQKMGFVPNMYAFMANSPGLLESYLHSYTLFRQESGFTPVEQEVVFLSISRENGCSYCMAAHSFVADAMSKVPAAVTDAIRNAGTIPDAKLAALSTFTRIMVEKRGLPTRVEVKTFLDGGYTERHILEIILAIGLKTFSNYANHLFHTPVDAMFESRLWND